MKNLMTAAQITKATGETKKTINFIIARHRIKPAESVSGVPLYDERKVKLIKQAICGFPIRRDV